MVVTKAEMIKACRQMGWQGHVRSLWKALDADDGGNCSFEELDPPSANLLARFWAWSVNTWGQKPSVRMFAALDSQRQHKLSYAEFAQACDSLGFHNKGAAVASCFDKQGKRFVKAEDFVCLDCWHPPQWLTTNPSKEAADLFKSQLLNKHGRYVKAWRLAIDKNNKNCCDWYEFC